MAVENYVAFRSKQVLEIRPIQRFANQAKHPLDLSSEIDGVEYRDENESTQSVEDSQSQLGTCHDSGKPFSESEDIYSLSPLGIKTTAVSPRRLSRARYIQKFKHVSPPPWQAREAFLSTSNESDKATSVIEQQTPQEYFQEINSSNEPGIDFVAASPQPCQAASMHTERLGLKRRKVEARKHVQSEASIGSQSCGNGGQHKGGDAQAMYLPHLYMADQNMTHGHVAPSCEATNAWLGKRKVTRAPNLSAKANTQHALIDAERNADQHLARSPAFHKAPVITAGDELAPLSGLMSAYKTCDGLSNGNRQSHVSRTSPRGVRQANVGTTVEATFLQADAVSTGNRDPVEKQLRKNGLPSLIVTLRMSQKTAAKSQHPQTSSTASESSPPFMRPKLLQTKSTIISFGKSGPQNQVKPYTGSPNLEKTLRPSGKYNLRSSTSHLVTPPVAGSSISGTSLRAAPEANVAIDDDVLAGFLRHHGSGVQHQRHGDFSGGTPTEVRQTHLQRLKLSADDGRDDNYAISLGAESPSTRVASQLLHRTASQIELPPPANKVSNETRKTHQASKDTSYAHSEMSDIAATTGSVEGKSTRSRVVRHEASDRVVQPDQTSGYQKGVKSKRKYPEWRACESCVSDRTHTSGNEQVDTVQSMDEPHAKCGCMKSSRTILSGEYQHLERSDLGCVNSYIMLEEMQKAHADLKTAMDTKLSAIKEALDSLVNKERVKGKALHAFLSSHDHAISNLRNAQEAN